MSKPTQRLEAGPMIIMKMNGWIVMGTKISMKKKGGRLTMNKWFSVFFYRSFRFRISFR